MCLFPMMTEWTRPWMPDSSNQPDQPILLLSQSLHLFHFQPSSPHYTLYINIA
jgi:hypothetical protein